MSNTQEKWIFFFFFLALRLVAPFRIAFLLQLEYVYISVRRECSRPYCMYCGNDGLHGVCARVHVYGRSTGRSLKNVHKFIRFIHVEFFFIIIEKKFQHKKYFLCKIILLKIYDINRLKCAKHICVNDRHPSSSFSILHTVSQNHHDDGPFLRVVYGRVGRHHVNVSVILLARTFSNFLPPAQT